jgi:hypothetical protein
VFPFKRQPAVARQFHKAVGVLRTMTVNWRKTAGTLADTPVGYALLFGAWSAFMDQVPLWKDNTALPREYTDVCAIRTACIGDPALQAGISKAMAEAITVDTIERHCVRFGRHIFIDVLHGHLIEFEGWHALLLVAKSGEPPSDQQSLSAVRREAGGHGIKQRG